MMWLYVIWGGFAALGVWTFVKWVMAGSKTVMETANNLVSTLRDATEVARAYREDLSFIRQIAQSGVTLNSGEEPESLISQPPAVPATMPPPYMGRYPVKPDEPDAPAEAVQQVDVTATEEELVEQESEEAAVSYEVSERQKAETQAADLERIRELTGNVTNEKPEGQ